jgi:hypothetical protein
MDKMPNLENLTLRDSSHVAEDTRNTDLVSLSKSEPRVVEKPIILAAPKNPFSNIQPRPHMPEQPLGRAMSSRSSSLHQELAARDDIDKKNIGLHEQGHGGYDLVVGFESIWSHYSNPSSTEGRKRQ